MKKRQATLRRAAGSSSALARLLARILGSATGTRGYPLAVSAPRAEGLADGSGSPPADAQFTFAAGSGDGGGYPPPGFRVAVIGAGLSGSLLAVHLLQHCRPSDRVYLIESRAGFGRGLAYSTTNPNHLLNVRAGNMSAFTDRPDHFVAWLGRRARETGEPAPTANCFVSRQLSCPTSACTRFDLPPASSACVTSPAPPALPAAPERAQAAGSRRRMRPSGLSVSR